VEEIQLQLDRVPSPVGMLQILTDDAGRVRSVDFDPPHLDVSVQKLQRQLDRPIRLIEGATPAEAARRVADYIAGDLSTLDRIEAEPFGTPFQRAVWRALRSVPVGETISYGRLAARIGRPTAARAVGMANNANPVPIIVPCHRVIGADGRLVGYGGGLERKTWLLAHERQSATVRQQSRSRFDE